VRRRRWWGWGYEGEGLSDDERAAVGELIGPRIGLDGHRLDPPAIGALSVAPARLQPPAALAHFVSDAHEERVQHAQGKAFRDVVRALHGRIDHPPDLVARPRRESEVAAVLEWCADVGAAVVPYGGGSSVVGGGEPDVGEGYRGAVTLDVGALGRVLEVDPLSGAARIEAGVLGPALEDQLRPHGLTLRHFPQSFEVSSLGGWIATRAGGHFATGPTHIDDLVESMRVITPAGVVETRRLPASGAGPSPDRLFLGSEGVLGVVTEAWVRTRPRPRFRAGATVRFDSFAEGAAAVRALAQSGLAPSNCRLLDPLEALVNGAGDGSTAVLIVGFESADHPLGPWAARAAELVADHGGVADGGGFEAAELGQEHGAARRPGSGGAADSWRSSFLRGPYLRDALVRLGALCETFETACTWDRFAELHRTVLDAAADGLAEAGAASGFVTCRLTHAYPDGAAPYFTVVAPATKGSELEQWDAVKAAASEAILRCGGTISHHHAVGRDHRPWYDRQRPALFAEALTAAKVVLDPVGVCNPGVLVDPGRRPSAAPAP
jgi:alkyldihydroxyacetonephosphate synthase